LRNKTILTKTGCFLLAAVVFCAAPAFANNIDVGNVSLEDKDTVGDTYDIEFDVAWSNSWRDAGAPSVTANWDAAWVFCKFAKLSAGAWTDWAHCTLLNTGSVAAAGATVDFADTGGAYKGAFVYRSSSGTGAVSFTNNQIRWDYGTDGVTDTDKVRIQVFAVEMVYIPQGSFYVGDADEDPSNCFHEGSTTLPLQITGEGAITVADTAGNLYYDADTGDAGDRAGPVPANFPKGYDAFYVMKYEISQRQYCEFLNSLTSTQASNRVDGGLHFNSYRNYIKKTAAGYYGVDGNNNAGAATTATRSSLNESTDGEWVACNYLSWMDAAAYADWAALRPLTELEYAKAARGPLYPQDDAYAWGSSTLESVTTALTDAAQVSEVPNQGNLNYTNAFPDGPFRTGGYADSSSTRTNGGLSYYGASEFSGNLWERTATLGNATGRAFTGSHGDGAVTTTGSYEGNATNTDWPGIDGTPARGVTGATGGGFRGGSWNTAAVRCVLSDRNNAAETNTTRAQGYGGRAGRTAP